jgi:enoyl-CoA hydratase/carnithine racemase
MTSDDTREKQPPQSAASRLVRLPHSDVIALDIVDRTLIVALDRPLRANALDETLMRDLRTLWQHVATESWVRCVVLTGSGKAFCAGADMAMLAAPRADVGETAAEELGFVPGRHLAVPVIVAVNGVCAGGGLHFVADADICIAARSARFVDPHVTAGQVSGLEPLELLGRVRRDVVVRMALLGRNETLDAEAARSAGLVSEVVEQDALLPRALELAATIAEGSPEAIRITRAVIRRFDDEVLRPHLEDGWARVQEHWQHPDSIEGPRAFTDKRAPRWHEDG